MSLEKPMTVATFSYPSVIQNIFYHHLMLSIYNCIIVRNKIKIVTCKNFNCKSKNDICAAHFILLRQKNFF